jgi:hypothetical protein
MNLKSINKQRYYAKGTCTLTTLCLIPQRLRRFAPFCVQAVSYAAAAA